VFTRGDTLCISTQLGCPIGCLFCASGKKGLIRNLSFEEIVGQYELAVSDGMGINNIAVAGIGEPLLNWNNVEKAFWYFKEKGLKVSFYTTGFPLKNFKKLLQLPHNGVSLSLHGVEDKKRKRIIPYGESIDSLLSVLKEHISNLSNRKKKLYSIAYLLIKGFNDTEEDLEKLADISKDLGLSVSLLKYNSIDGVPFDETTDEEYERAFLFLKERGIKTTLSNRYRTRKIGGCGTLMVNRLQDKTL